jgi:hypothetical protein
VSARKCGRSTAGLRRRVGVQGAAHDQPGAGDGFDAEQVPVGQRPARFSRLDKVVVAGVGEQVARTGPGAVGDADRGPGCDDAQADQVVADAAAQFPAQRVIGGHQQHIGAIGGQCDVGGRGGVHHLLRFPALAQRRHDCHYAQRLRRAGVAELPIHIRWCMGVTLLIFMPSRVTRQAIKIRNETTEVGLIDAYVMETASTFG